MSDMTKDELIARLKDDLHNAMEWAHELGDEYLDGDPDIRRQFFEDMKSARDSLRIKVSHE